MRAASAWASLPPPNPPPNPPPMMPGGLKLMPGLSMNAGLMNCDAAATPAVCVTLGWTALTAAGLPTLRKLAMSAPLVWVSDA